jgi:hypothetical protein
MGLSTALPTVLPVALVIARAALETVGEDSAGVNIGGCVKSYEIERQKQGKQRSIR